MKPSTEQKSIDNMSLIRSECALLDDLMKLAESANAISAADVKERESPELPWHDTVYSNLAFDIVSLDKSHPAFKMVEKLCETGRGLTHSAFELNLKRVFELNLRKNEAVSKDFKRLPNKTLLWHGSRLVRIHT